jgi:hypothetical protein
MSVLMYLLYICGSICFLAGSVIGLALLIGVI